MSLQFIVDYWIPFVFSSFCPSVSRSQSCCCGSSPLSAMCVHVCPPQPIMSPSPSPSPSSSLAPFLSLFPSLSLSHCLPPFPSLTLSPLCVSRSLVPWDLITPQGYLQYQYRGICCTVSKNHKTIKQKAINIEKKQNLATW